MNINQGLENPSIYSTSNLEDVESSGISQPIPTEKIPLIDAIATEYIGTWNRLISQTNWEKGKVIHIWRTRLAEEGLPRNIYSDDAIAKRIGNVSGQHVGRLRRVYERFGSVVEQYSGLFWSHFQAAIDWDDADEWLRDAVSQSWSVAVMRLKRWEAYGGPEEKKPQETDIVVAEQDEDVNPFNDSEAGFPDPNRQHNQPAQGASLSSGGVPNENWSGEISEEHPIRGPKQPDENNEPPFDIDDDSSSSDSDAKNSKRTAIDAPEDSDLPKTSDIFAQLNELEPLPENFASVFEQLKVEILREKVNNWENVSPQRLLTWMTLFRSLILSEE